MEQKRKWRKRKETRRIDDWQCPWCGHKNDGWDVLGSDGAGSPYTYRGECTCSSCGKNSFVVAEASFQYTSEPIEENSEE